MSLGARLAEVLEPGDVLGLVGTLGAGKTCLVKGLAHGLGVTDERAVVSPTFVLMRRYPGRLVLYHFDAYRLDSGIDMAELGCQEVFDSGGVSVIEWADHVAECLPAEHFLLTIRVAGPSRREISLACAGQGPQSRFARIRSSAGLWISDS